jgi:putative tricarboxylic transport membrane protein
MRKSLRATVTAVVLMLCVGLSACGGVDGAVSGLRIMVPNNPGSGYDLTARSAAKVLEDAGLTRNVEVFNLPGGSGTVGLQRLVNERGNGTLVMQMGLGVVGGVYTSGSRVGFGDTTPIARLIEDPECIVVPADSPYRSLDQLVAAWTLDPRSIGVAGGSGPGGPDHLATHLFAQAVGLDPKAVDYVAYDGGGDLLAALLGDQVAFGVSSPGEFLDQIQAGQLRVLAVTSARRVPGVDAPTMREAGVDLEFTNWRGIVAPPGISDRDRRTLTTLVDAMHSSPEWKQVLERNNFTDAYLAGDEFDAFLRAENDRVASVLRRLGLTPA